MAKSNIVVSDNNTPYKYIQKLGSGTYGITWMAINLNTNQKVAIKIFKRPGKIGEEEIEDIKEDWNIEINALKKVLPKCSPYAVCIKDYWFGNGTAKIVMDFVRGESLNKQIVGGSQGIKLSKRKNDHTLLKNMISGIKSIHSQGVVHQDIKGDNIMFDYDYDDGYYRYIDFGLSCIKKGEKVNKNRDNWPCGSIGTRYTSPLEIVKASKKRVVFDWSTLEAHDYWSIGVVLLRWYTFDGNRYYYSNLVNDYAKTDKAADKLATDINAYSVYPYYFKFPKKMLCGEINKIKDPAVKLIVTLLLEKDPNTRWENFKTISYILDSNAKLPEDSNIKWAPIRSSIEKLRLE